MAIALRSLCTVAVLVLLPACALTVPTVDSEQTAPPPPADPPLLAYSVGDFNFAIGGRDMAPSRFDGRLLGDEITASWERLGYIRDPEFVDSDDEPGPAPYRLTVSGSLRNETSFGAQLLNALTLMLIPYSVTHQYDLHVALADLRSGAHYDASARTVERTYVGLFMVTAFPFSWRGHAETMRRVSIQLYEQLRANGAFADSIPSRLVGR